MTDKAIVLSNMDEIERAATAMSKSKYFTDAAEQAQAVVKILAGREMGFGPFASMTGIFIISGKPSIGANLQAAAVKGSGKYDYKIREMSEMTCKIEFFQGKESIGISEFTAADAKKALTKNMDKFPRNMLFARAMSNGVRWFCPDVFNGAPVYTPEELGADIDDDGNVIPGTFKDITPPPPTAADKPDVINAHKALQESWAYDKLTFVLASTVKETAKKGETGKLYIDLDNDTLIGKQEGLLKLKSKNGMTPEQYADVDLKLSTIAGILVTRAKIAEVTNDRPLCT